MFLKKIIVSSLFVCFSGLSFAGEFPGLEEGKDYLKFKTVETVVPVTKGKPTVVEFFWYGCSHCFKIKPLSEKLFKKYENKINSIQYPVGFDGWESGARTFFTLQEMNILNQMHDKVFNEIHTKGNLSILKNKNKMNGFLKENGVDVVKFNNIYKSPSVNLKWNEAVFALTADKIDGSPDYVIYNNGYTYKVSPALVNSYEKTIENLDKILSIQVK